MLIHSTPTSVTANQPRPVPAEMKQCVQRSGKPALPSHKTGRCWHWTWCYCQTTLSKLDCFSFQKTSCCLHPAHQQSWWHSFLHSFIRQISSWVPILRQALSQALEIQQQLQETRSLLAWCWVQHLIFHGWRHGVRAYKAFIQPWGLDRITTTIKITIKEDDTFLPRLRGRYHVRGFMTILL